MFGDYRDYIDPNEDGWQGSYEEVRQDRYTDSVEIDGLDITGLTGKEASTLSCLCNVWNGMTGKNYNWRDGKRYLTAKVRCLNLDHWFIKSLSCYHDLVQAIGYREIYYK